MDIESWLSSETPYLVTVLLLIFLALWLGLRYLNRARIASLKNAKKGEAFEAVSTEATEYFDEDTESITKQAAVESIENRFHTIRRFYVPIILLIGLTLLILPALPTIPATYISLFAGVVAVVIGIAARPVLENAASGVVITFSQPVRVNDTIRIDGKYGTVEKINFFYTTIKIWNWNRWIIPNHRLLQKEFENLSRGEDQQWAYVEFYVEPSADINQVKTLAKTAMQCPYLSDIEPPSFWVMGLEKDSIQCWVAGWAKNAAEAWALTSITRRNLAESLGQADIKFQSIKADINMPSPS